MIVFDLQCLASGDRFEAWFRSNADFDEQVERGLIQCPSCNSREVTKAPMAPLVSGHGGEAASVVAKLSALQAEMLRDSQWVGERFAETARAMHLGEIASSPVHGEATATQVRSLVEDEVPIAPLPLPVVPRDQVN